MILEPLALQNANPNITQIISENTSDITSQILTSVWNQFLPIIQVLGGLLFLYIVYRIITAIASHLLRKRIKRIDLNVQDLNKKTDEILRILSKKEHKYKKK